MFPRDTTSRRTSATGTRARSSRRSGHQPTDPLADEIKSFVRDHLSAYACPRKIEFVDDLPKTLTGKIRRIELRQREQAG
jgi:acyl-coenzyme A synthetase/AMP-(fatty) acid ligase